MKPGILSIAFATAILAFAVVYAIDAYINYEPVRGQAFDPIAIQTTWELEE